MNIWYSSFIDVEIVPEVRLQQRSKWSWLMSHKLRWQEMVVAGGDSEVRDAELRPFLSGLIEFKEFIFLSAFSLTAWNESLALVTIMCIAKKCRKANPSFARRCAPDDEIASVQSCQSFDIWMGITLIHGFCRTQQWLLPCFLGHFLSKWGWTGTTWVTRVQRKRISRAERLREFRKSLADGTITPDTIKSSTSTQCILFDLVPYIGLLSIGYASFGAVHFTPCQSRWKLKISRTVLSMTVLYHLEKKSS